MDKGGYEAGLRYLVARQMDIYVIQILAARGDRPGNPRRPQARRRRGRRHRRDHRQRPLLKRYKANLASYCAAVKDFCTRRGITYLFTTNQIAFERLILNYLRDRGLVK